MEDLGGINGIAKKVFLVLMLTVVPLAIIVKIWAALVYYWQLIASIALIGIGSIFIYFYYKEYAVEDIKIKVKKYINKLTGSPTDEERKILQGEVKQKTQGFLSTGLFLEVAGFYLLIQFFRTH